MAGEVDVVVRSEELTDPAVINWMRDFQARVLERGGYSGENPSCDERRPLPAVLADRPVHGRRGSADRSSARRPCCEAIPPYLSEAVVTRDPESGEIGDTANIPFGVRVGPLDEQQDADRRHPLRGRCRRRAARGHRGRARRPGRDRRRGQRRPRGEQLLAAVRRPAGRRARAARPLPLAAPGAGAAAADRARDGLVVARRRRDGRRPEPDVGDARRPGDRDRDRVQRAALAALRERARRRALGRRGPARHLLAHRHRRAGLGRRPRSPASPR